MKQRFITLGGILLFAVSVIVLLVAYPPQQRTFISPRQIMQINNTEQLVDIWSFKEAKGRNVLLFTRNLNGKGELSPTFENSYIDRALQRGIIRSACMVVSDIEFPAMYRLLANKQLRSPLMTTKNGVAMLYEAGRLDIIPLSKFIPPKEVPLIVFEPAAFTQGELQNINRMFNTGQLSSDLLIILGF